MFAHDVDHMQQALAQAKQALAQGEVPVGAVVVSPYGELLGSGYNMVEALYTQAEHAEVRALRAAGIQTASWRLTGCSLYVTLEPCTMCMNLAALSRIERIIYGAASPRFGASLDNNDENKLYTRQIKCVTGGICAQEAAALLEHSFALARKRNGCQPRISEN